MIKKRYFYLTEEILNENPKIATYDVPSLDAWKNMLVLEVSRLGEKAALKAMEECGGPSWASLISLSAPFPVMNFLVPTTNSLGS